MTLPLSPQQIELIQNSWESIKPLADSFGKAVYDKVSQIDPEMGALFNTGANSTEMQGRTLVFMMNAAVASLSQHEQQYQLFTHLGQRHLEYGVKQKDYHTLGVAWLETMQTVLGDKFDNQQYHAWLTLYQYLTQIMSEANGQSTK